MKRKVFAVAVSVTVVVCAVSAHHGYANFLTDHPITIEGTLENIQYVNPHVIMKIRADDSTVYTVTWQGAGWVARRANVTASTFHVGDRLIVNGAPSRNPEIHELSSVRLLSRPRDGWTWRSPVYPR